MTEIVFHNDWYKKNVSIFVVMSSHARDPQQIPNSIKTLEKTRDRLYGVGNMILKPIYTGQMLRYRSWILIFLKVLIHLLHSFLFFS